MTANIDTMIRKAATAALTEWHTGQYDRQSASLDDLINDLWVWYLESPATQRKLEDSDEFLARRLIYKAAMQVLAEGALSQDVFDGKVIFSSDAVIEALRGGSNNRYLQEILPFAMKNLAKRPRKGVIYAEAIRNRYTDGIIPEQGSPAVLVSRAVKALTEEVNVIYLTTDHSGIGSAAAVFPDTRKQKGDHSDPTGNIAVMLLERPEMRGPFYEETPLHQILGGRGATPAYDLGDGRTFRPTGYVAEVLRRYPQLVEPYLEKVRLGTGK